MICLLIYHLAVSAFLLLVTLNIALNWRLFIAPQASECCDFGIKIPRISVLVPARNEAHRITRCVHSLCTQDYPDYEVFVLDDHSEDGTAGLVLGLGFSRDVPSARRLLDGKPLPTGWTGKSWACHQLAAAATGDYLLFTDADTEHAPTALRTFVGHALNTRASLLSAWPQQITGTWSERAVIPLVYVLLLGALPHYLLHRLQRHPEYARGASRGTLETLGAANGQFMLFRRDAYEEIGGHGAVRNHLVEDVALGRLMAARVGEGMRLINCDGSRQVRCRMYESFSEVWEGFTKNLRAAFAESAFSFWLFGLLQTAGLLLPFLFACVPRLSGQWWWLPVGQVVWIYVLRLVLAVRFRTSMAGAWLHPLGQGLSLLIGLNSWRLSAQKGVTWKGRTYCMNESATSTETVPIVSTTTEKKEASVS